MVMRKRQWQWLHAHSIVVRTAPIARFTAAQKFHFMYFNQQEGRAMTQQRKQNAERIREVRLQLQSLIEDLYWGDIDGAKIDDFQRNQANQVYLLHRL